MQLQKNYLNNNINIKKKKKISQEIEFLFIKMLLKESHLFNNFEKNFLIESIILYSEIFN